MKLWSKLVMLAAAWFAAQMNAADQAAPVAAKNPSVLIVNGRPCNLMNKGDFAYFQELNQRGFQLDVHFSGPRPLNWELIRKYNCLVMIDLPPDEAESKGKSPPPYRKEMMELLDRYLQAGGGVFILPDFQ
ncbi:MAG: hypothetical protein HY360_14460, partial [Verrucomicrobia bacterium]|nr:hypothetical protein [Verrucomicrobiota bacterium]